MSTQPGSFQATTIDEVIEHLDEIVAGARRDESRIGFFASMYRLVTIEIKRRCEAKHFNDNDWIRELDVVFANYYFRAHGAFSKGETICQSWALAFEAAKSPRPIVLQHLLLGMNAHISFDLGMAVIDLCGDQLTPARREDFDRINAILAEMIDDVQDRLRRVSPLLDLLDIMTHFDEALTAFSVKIARGAAWNFAEELSRSEAADQEKLIAKRDEAVAGFGRRLLNPGGIVMLGAGIIRLTERQAVPSVMNVLA